jgi:uncharacterized surface protein with fasciclin (FAS1) repeats
VLLLALLLAGCDSEDLGSSDPEVPSIADYVTEIPAFSALNTAVQDAGLAETLDTGGPFTVFAPTNGAFSPPLDVTLDEQLGEQVLLRHVLAGVDSTAQLRALAEMEQTASPLAGGPLTFTLVNEDGMGPDTLKVNAAVVTNANASAANGLVHVVDRLLADAVDRATLTPRFTLFARLVAEAGLEGTLRSPGANDGLTIFAPTNAALRTALDTNENGQVESGEIPANAADILSYHVLDSVFLATDVPTSATAVTSLEGSDLTVVRDAESGAVTVNPNDEGASVVVADVVVDNGVIHGIDTVLIP